MIFCQSSLPIHNSYCDSHMRLLHFLVKQYENCTGYDACNKFFMYIAYSCLRRWHLMYLFVFDKICLFIKRRKRGIIFYNVVLLCSCCIIFSGTIAFLRSISVEAVGLGVHLAAGAHDILLQAEYLLTSIPPSVPWPSRSKTNFRSNQPKDAQQGIQQVVIPNIN